MKLKPLLFSYILTLVSGTVSAQSVLFDFDNAPQYTSLPLYQASGGITAHLYGNYSIQAANVLGFTPAGFSGRVIYPNSVFLYDLQISFDHALNDFSIMYSPQQLGCDDAETMRVTAYMNGVYVGTNTRTTAHPGTWPTDTLSCSFTSDFDSVVVHYDSPPPTCADYGVIFLADNMRVIPSTNSVHTTSNAISGLTITNPVTSSSEISFSLFKTETISVKVYDITGKCVKDIYEGEMNAGEHSIPFHTNDELTPGVYFLTINGQHFSKSSRIVVAE